MSALYTLKSSSLPEDLSVRHFRGTEGISKLYSYDIHCVAPDASALDLADAIGQRATLVLDRGEDEPIETHGIIASIRHVAEESGHAWLAVKLVPLAWHLAESEHSRVFTNMSLPDIVKSVLEDAGLGGDDYELRVEAELPTEEHVTQYRESDLDFLSRWFEREGLYWFFDQSGGVEKLVITDKNPSDALVDDAIRYHPVSGGDQSAGGCIDAFACELSATPAAIKLVDYDYQKPSLALEAEAKISKIGQAKLQRAGARFFKAKEGDRLAKVRAESYQARAEIAVGSTTVRGLLPGYVFELGQHPRSDFNKKYLVVELEHAGVGHQGVPPEIARALRIDGREVYRAHFRAVDQSVPFRAADTHRWPRIHGTELARVDGEADSEYAQIDDHGRYLVRMMFDEVEAEDGKASTWVRMAQPHGGTREGFHFPLRKGTEVIVSFLGGDPDRPVIAGVVHNIERPSVVTKANHTQNRIFTGGGNQVELEDLKDKEYITLYTPKDHTTIHMGEPDSVGGEGAPEIATKASLGLSTDGCSVYSVGGSWSIGVGGTKTETVNGAVTETYHATKDETVDGAVTETYNATHTETVSGAVTETYGADHAHTVSGSNLNTISGGLVDFVGGSHNYTVAGALVGTVGPVVWVSGATMETIGGALTKTVTGARTDTIGGSHTMSAPAAMWHHGAVTWAVDGVFSVSAGALATIAAPTVMMLTSNFIDTSGSRTNAAASEDNVTGFKAEACGLKLEAVGASIAALGADVAYVGLAVSLANAEMSECGIQLKLGGPEVTTKAIKIFS